MSDLDERFERMQQDAKSVSGRPSNDALREIYGLYKQATIGDADASGARRPGRLDVIGRAKYDAWAAQKGIPNAEAKERYIALIERLLSR